MTDHSQIALENFEMMKNTLAQAQTNYTGLYRLWLLYGALNLFSALSGYLGVHLIMNGAQGAGRLLMLLQELVIPVVLVVFYLMIFRRESRIANKYYLSCLALWGVPAVALPVFTEILKTVLGLLRPSGLSDILGRINDAGFLINMFLLCLCCMICSYLLNKKWMMLIGLILLFAYLTLNAFSDLSGFSIALKYQAESSVSLSFSGLFYHVLMVFGYLVAALAVKTISGKERKASDGL